uniref:Reverse transcriptase Ty1/copia-type domain-containing protein n=1 Tax=Tanacetum cinerariifolium TaxID=118510 RepID=A0A6L2JY72_TANCI|nr:hypothetical protein [Tanacetum cinerariifolium]
MVSSAPQDKWSQDKHIELVNIISNPRAGMLTRVMAKGLSVASAHECLFVDFLYENEPKEVSKALKHPRFARLEAIRIFLAFATYMNLTVYHMDVKSAFLNGKLKEEVYVKQPPSFKSSEFPNHIYKLDKPLYGLKQAPRACSSVKTLMVPPNNFRPDLNGKSVNETQYRGFDLKGYFDSDYVGLNIDKKGKAEYVAVVGCCANILWMKSQLTDYDIIYEKVPIFCDNTSAIAISNNPVSHSRTKRIDIRYHFIRDHILKGDIELHFIPTQY